MNIDDPIRLAALPDTRTLPSELRLGDFWDTAAVRSLIRAKCWGNQTPAFLFLGRKEAGLLRAHLAAAFGDEAAAQLKHTYYMGLQVVELAVDSFLHAGGCKMARTLQDPIACRPPWRDHTTSSLWQLLLN